MMAKWSSGKSEVFLDMSTMPCVKKMAKSVAEQETYELSSMRAGGCGVRPLMASSSIILADWRPKRGRRPRRGRRRERCGSRGSSSRWGRESWHFKDNLGSDILMVFKFRCYELIVVI